MTPKEKAKELVSSFMSIKNIKLSDYSVIYLPAAKQCALISIEFAREFITGDLNEAFDKTMYLFEVKKEIEKL